MSAILSTDDLNDFISPGVACIKPIENISVKNFGTVCSLASGAFSYTKDSLEVSFNTEFSSASSDHTRLSPQISLTDCLACSGCVTSAEAVLVSLQSHSEVLAELDSGPALRISSDGSLANLDHGGRIYVASVSPQTRASLAATFGVTQAEAGHMIEQLLSGSSGIKNRAVYRNYFQWVVDTNVARNICLVMGANEFMSSLQTEKENHRSDNNTDHQVRRPILTSSCPGWICYAEKTHPHVLPHLSRLKSPQALTGILLKTTLSRIFGISPSRIWHVAIMPCFDKKLEASREELTDTVWAGNEREFVRDVDSVLTSKELLMLAHARRVDFAKLPRHPVPRIPFPDSKLNSFLFPGHGKLLSNRSRENGTSGGNLLFILNYFVSQNPGSAIHTKRGRNSDFLEYSVLSSTGELLLRAARCYGFRNIQNLVRRLKPPKAPRMPGSKPIERTRQSHGNSSCLDYCYVEVMACPGGCTNGGGQIKFDDPILSEFQIREINSSPLSQKSWISKVEGAYFSEYDSLEEAEIEKEQTTCVDEISLSHVMEVIAHWADLTKIDLARLVFTTYRRVDSEVGKNIDHTQKVIQIAGKVDGGW